MEYNKYTLDNGTELYVVQSDLYQTTGFQMDFYSRKNGTEAAKSLVAGVLAEGSKNYPTNAALSLATDREYARYSITSNGIGDLHSITFSINMLTAENLIGEQKTLENSLGIIADTMLHPLIERGKFRKEYFAKQKKELGLILQKKKMESRSLAIRKFKEMALGSSPFALHELGTEKKLERTWNPNVIRAYLQMLEVSPRKAYVGTNLEPDYIAEAVERAFKGLSRVDSEIKVGMPPKKKHGRREEQSRFEQSLIISGYPVNIPEDQRAWEALYLLNGCIGGYNNARLFSEIRVKRDMAYYAYSSLDTDSGLLYGYSGVDIKNKDEVASIMTKEIGDIGGTLSEQEFNEAKNYLLKTRAMNMHKKSMKLFNLKKLVLEGKADWLQNFERRFEDITYQEVKEAASLIEVDKPIVYCQLQEVKE